MYSSVVSPYHALETYINRHVIKRVVDVLIFWDFANSQINSLLSNIEITEMSLHLV